MKEQVGPMPMTEYFIGLEEACRAQSRVVPSVQMWVCTSLWGHISSKENFCAEAASWLNGLWGLPPARVLLCASSRGRGNTPRMRQHYGLWKTLNLVNKGLRLGNLQEEKIGEGDDFFFVGTADLPDGLTDHALLSLWSAGRASKFLYLARSGSLIDQRRLTRALLEVFTGDGLPFFASFDLYPLFDLMPAGDGVVCFQNYGDGLAVYLFEREASRWRSEVPLAANNINNERGFH